MAAIQAQPWYSASCDAFVSADLYSICTFNPCHQFIRVPMPHQEKTATTTGPVFPRNAKPLVNKPGGSGLNSMVRFRPRAGRRPRTVTARFPRKQGRTRVPWPLSSGFLSRFLALTVVLATNLSHLGSWKRCLLALQLEESLLLLCWGAEVSEDGLVWK